MEQSKLYNVLGIPRWGVPFGENRVHYQATAWNGKVYMEYSGYENSPVLWDTAKQGNPTIAQFEDAVKGL